MASPSSFCLEAFVINVEGVQNGPDHPLDGSRHLFSFVSRSYVPEVTQYSNGPVLLITASSVFSFASCSVKKRFYICTFWPTYTLILIYVMSHNWYISRAQHLTIIFHYLLIQLLFSWVYIMSKLQLQHRNCPSLCTSQVAVSELWRWIMARTLLLQNIMTSQWIWPQIKCHNFHILSYDTFVS